MHLHPFRHAVRVALIAIVAIGIPLLAPAPKAEAAYPEVIEQLSADIQIIGVNTPIWLSQHLPAMMAQAGLGAGIDLSDDGGSFALGIIPIRIGLMNGFSKVGAGTEILGLEDVLPDNLPWPQFGISAGLGVGAGIELGIDVQFIPEMDLNLFEALSLRTGVISIAASVRWRVNAASGAIPAFIVGVGASYYHGLLGFGANYKDSFSFEAEREEPAPGGGTANVKGRFEGEYEFSGGPEMGWDLFQVSPEFRLAWSLGPFRPYFGFAFGASFGEVWGGASLSAKGSATFISEASGGGQTTGSTETIAYEESAESYIKLAPAKYLLRPFVGFDIAVGIFAITIQVDYAVMLADVLDVDLANVGTSFTGGGFYSEASNTSVQSEAVVGTIGIRLAF